MPHTFTHCCACHSPADHAGGTTPHSHPRIDVHHHIAPPFYTKEMNEIEPMQGPLANWSLAKTIEDQEQGGVSTSMLTVTTPGFWFGDIGQTNRLVRNCNDYAAKLVTDHPGRFGMFVSMPLPNIEASLREIEYGLDVLKADGIALYTNYRDKWLGDRSFDPVMEELNRRKAVVHVHPDVPDCTRNIGAPYRAPMLEYGTDTSRAIGFMLFNGAAHRFPDITFIWSHAGGTMPFLIERYTREPAGTPAVKQHVPDGVLTYIRRFYYDTAQAAHVSAMGSLKSVVDPSHILFGTDFPFRSSAEHVKGLKECGVFDAAELAAIDYVNSHRLLPRVKSWA